MTEHLEMCHDTIICFDEYPPFVPKRGDENQFFCLKWSLEYSKEKIIIRSLHRSA